MSKELTDFFAKEEIENLAHESKFVQRNSNKVNGENFLNVLLFTQFNQEELSLNCISGQLRDKYGVVISSQGVDERFTENSVSFMKVMLETLLKKVISEQPVIPFLEKFNSIRIKDSTAFQLPPEMEEKYKGSGGSGSKSMIRIQFEYDYRTGKVYDLNLHSFNDQDKTNAKQTMSNVGEDDLILRDLGYVSIEVLRSISEKKAQFLNRINTITNVYEKKNGKLELLDMYKVQKYMDKKKMSHIEKDVFIGAQLFAVRMIIERLPEEFVEARLQKAKKEAKKKGRQLSNKFTASIRLNVYVTNIVPQTLEASNVRTLYRLRWQIELVFKVWKSIGEIQKVKKMKIERFETLLYAKLIWICLNWAIFWEIDKVVWAKIKQILSPYKTYQTLKDRTYKMWLAFRDGKEAIALFIQEICEMSTDNHLLEKKKTQLSSLEIMQTFNKLL